jgi:hypothetical protein
MADLTEWFAARDMLRGLYHQELGRDVAGDPDALANWLYHWRDGGAGEAEIRAAIRTSPEWKQRHPGVEPDPSPLPPTARPPQSGSAGIVELATARDIRPRPTREQIAAFLPARGPFTFPAPYGTRGIRLTNASEDGSIPHPLGMSYWPNINMHAGQPDVLVFASLNDSLVLWRVVKATGEVALVKSLPFHGTGEGIYWSLTNPHLLYAPQGDRLTAYDVVTGEVHHAVSVPGVGLKQCHSSADGQVHSFTLEGGPAVWKNGNLSRWTPLGTYDECQITKSGRYLVIKEGTANRIVELATGSEWTITDQQGAVGHSDTGWDSVVGEDDQTQPGGCFRRWDFTPDGPQDGGVVYHTDWTSMSRYISHCNARYGAPGPQIALVSSSYHSDTLRGNELVVVLLDGSLQCRTVAPNLNTLHDGEYWSKTRANICPAGQYACCWGNLGTDDRADIFLVEL